jgi:hypothetical protein
LEGEKNAIYCSTHKLENMINVKDKTCLFEGCKTSPAFNIEGTKTGLYCLTHKLPNMINVKDKTCVFEGCKTRPAFNIEGTKTGLYCLTHKLPNMINVVSKTCVFDNCKKIPTFNLEGEKKAIYCSTHKLENMINVKDKTCVFDNCKTIPTFNIEGEPNAIYCSLHKKEGMIDIKHKTCLFEGCKTRPTFNFEGEPNAIYCSTHKEEGMIDIKHKMCKSDWCYTRVTDKYDGYCLYCFIHLFPEKTVARNYKTKERTVVEFVLKEFPQYPWINDKQIQGGCSRRRPDLLMDFGYQLIIIEIDENQHTGENYGDCSCENKRMMLLSQDVGYRPIIFIRFNPDDYLDKGKNITSCFGVDNNGVCSIKKTKQKEWTHRLNILRENIQYWSKNKSEKTIEIIQLFYDID